MEKFFFFRTVLRRGFSCAGLILLGIFFTSLVSFAQTLPDAAIRGVGKLIIYDTGNSSGGQLFSGDQLSQGTATFVDNGGCFFTNSHVVLPLEEVTNGRAVVQLQTKRDVISEELSFEAEIIYVDESRDLAYGCPLKNTQFFTHFFPRLAESNFEQRPYGEPGWILGYPQAGLTTVSVSPGQIIGFIDQPDLSEFFGMPAVDETKLRLYKSDALSGGGVSGGAYLDENLNLIGIPFAGSITPGGFMFILSEDVYIGFERELRQYYHTQGLVPSDCVYDVNSGYYNRAGEKHYDNQCSLAFDPTLEHEIRNSYQVVCGRDITSFEVVPALRRSKELGDLSAWSELMFAMCDNSPEQSAESETIQTEGIGIEAEIVPIADFAYGKPRLKSLAQEQNLARQLKSVIDTKFPKLQIHQNDWSTVVNSYIYGGYTVEAINRAIELGGYTVHPQIPFAVWRGSDDYQLYI